MAHPKPHGATQPRRARLGTLRLATYGVMAAMALVFGYVESLVPLPVPVPGIKLGLANIVVLYALLAFGPRPGLAIMVVKVCASSLLFGNPTMFMYSLAGGFASFAAMALSTRWRSLSVVGVSMVGGVFHMAGQLLMVGAVLTPAIALAYAPVLLPSGLASGLLVGYLCRLVLRATSTSAVFREQRKQMAWQARAAKGSDEKRDEGGHA